MGGDGTGDASDEGARDETVESSRGDTEPAEAASGAAPPEEPPPAEDAGSDRAGSLLDEKAEPASAQSGPTESGAADPGLEGSVVVGSAPASEPAPPDLGADGGAVGSAPATEPRPVEPEAEGGTGGSAPAAEPPPAEPEVGEPDLDEGSEPTVLVRAGSEPTVSLAPGAARAGAESSSDDSSPAGSEQTVRVAGGAGPTGGPVPSERGESESTVVISAGARQAAGEPPESVAERTEATGSDPTVSTAAGSEGTDQKPGGSPAPEEPGRSAAAAVLLNLTGLGLGYVYLRRWLRATASGVLVAMMVVVAFANDASNTPWLWRILAAAWAVATAFDAWLVARSLSRPGRRVQWIRPVAVGFVAVLAVVAGHIGYAEAGRATYAAGVEAQGRADCTEANRAFDALTGPYELTLSRDVPAAALRGAECTEFLGAEGAERSGAHAEAVDAYRTFRRDHAASVLEPFAQEGTRRVLLTWADALRSAGDLDGAIARYHELLEELGVDPDPRIPQVRENLAASLVERASAMRPRMAAATGQDRVDAMRYAMDDLLYVGQHLAETPTAASVPQAVLDTYNEANSAVAQGRFCDALPVLDYAVTLPADAGLAQVANGDRARSLSECGLANFNAGDYTGATDRFQRLVADYPNDPGVPQARSAIIAAEVGRAAGLPLPLPAPLDAPAAQSVTLYNAAASEVRVLVAGPTAHEVTLPPCAGCPEVYETRTGSCPGSAGKPSVTLRMQPGTYYVLQERATMGPDQRVNEPLNVPAGAGWELCVTTTRGI
jgi:tetratricopeptide (TPR) repeat protein